MKRLINAIIQLIKKDDFSVSPDIKTIDLIVLVRRRVIMFIKGHIKLIGVKKKGRVTFVGKKVDLRHKKFIQLGNSVTIEDFVEIDALSKKGVILGNNIRVGAYSKIKCTGTIRKLGIGISIGDNSGVGEFSYFGAAGGIQIGDNVIMGQNVRFHSENHNFSRVDVPIKEQGVTSLGIVIGNDCWIGAGVVFLDGVKVGDGCVIGANSLVNKDIPAYSVAVGNPVRIIKNRKREK